MSSLTKSLEKRIQELASSIEAQKTQLAAYERVLTLEVAKEHAPHELSSDVAPTHMPGEVSPKEEAKPAMPPSLTTAPDLSDLEFTGNKTNLVAAIVKKYGSSGATPKEVDAIFTSRKVARSKNLIYNTLSYLVAQKKLARKEGRYYAIGTKQAPSKGLKKTATPGKRKMSAEGIRRIREANKKRWAAKRAADAAAAKGTATKKAVKKKAA